MRGGRVSLQRDWRRAKQMRSGKGDRDARARPTRRILSVAPTQRRSSRFMMIASWNHRMRCQSPHHGWLHSRSVSHLRDPPPHRHVASLLPIQVRQARLRSSSVSVHDVAVRVVAGEKIGDNFTEGPGIQALVYVGDGVVDVLLRGGNAASHVSASGILLA
eukprot:3366819-Rhodomonas_salina.1